MTKRFLIAVLVLAALLVLAVPAFAAGPGTQGYRSDFTKTTACAPCHTSGTIGPAVYNDWAGTKHAVSDADDQGSRGPESQCAGCHTSNYDPSKASPSPSPSGTTIVGIYSYPSAVPTDNSVPYPFTEGDVGCSSCHYGSSLGQPADANDTAHSAPFVNMANADICGQCHSRYAYSPQGFHVQPTPSPSAPTDAIVQTQYAVNYKMLGVPDGSGGWTDASPLSSVLITQTPGWSPTPIPSTSATPATPGKASSLMTYWKLNGADTIWQNKGHDGSAAQYPEWASSLHANSLVGLRTFVPNAPQSCLKCHSADYRISLAKDPSAAPSTLPNIDTAKYGITCVGCHTTHKAGDAKGAWDEGFDAQLVGNPANRSDVCTECHTAEVAGTAAPGDEIHNATKEIMNGTGAIGVPETPSVHKGKCVQCHMPPTSFSRGSVQLGGNHTMTIIDPEVAADVTPIPVSTTTPSPSASPVVNTSVMPFSSCSTCHGKPSDPLATYLQGTIEDRQAFIHGMIDTINTELDAAAVRMGYADQTDAFDTIMLKAAADRTNSEISFLKARTNVEFADSEGSYGVHNWAYSVAIVNKALDQAQAAKTTLDGIDIAAAPMTLTYGSTLAITGTITGGDQALLAGGQVKLWQQKAGSAVWNVVGVAFVEGDLSNEYSFEVTPSASAIYKAQFLGNDTYEAISSAPTAQVDVAWKVTFGARPATVVKGRSITFSGAVGPIAAASGKTVIIQKKTSTGWVTWKTVTNPVGADGKWSFKVKMTKKGKMTLRAEVASDTTHAKGDSASKVIRVK